MSNQSTAIVETVQAVDSAGLLIKNEGGDTVITIGDDGTATLADGSQLASSAAPTADADIANKKYVDDQSGTTAFGEFTNLDDENNTLLPSHAYLANQDGFVLVEMNPDTTGDSIQVFIGDTTDPMGEGTRVAKQQGYGVGFEQSVNVPVKSGKYWEVYHNGTSAKIFWFPIGTLIKPTDQD
jgi:hypothetical protein